MNLDRAIFVLTLVFTAISAICAIVAVREVVLLRRSLRESRPRPTRRSERIGPILWPWPDPNLLERNDNKETES